MWLDSSNELNMVSMEDAERLLTDELVRRLRACSDHEIKSLSSQVNLWLRDVWDTNSEFVADPNEASFEQIDPPRELHLRPPRARATLADSLIAQLRGTPVRWRTDLTMALVIFLEVDLPLERGHIETRAHE